MGKTATNILILLGILTFAYAGYYLYTQRSATTLQTANSDQTMQNMLNNTHAFIEHRKVLDEVVFESGVLSDPRFTALRTYSDLLPARPVGRSNPFAAPSSNQN